VAGIEDGKIGISVGVGGVRALGLGTVGFKPRGLRDDRGYRVAVVEMWVGLAVKRHPLKAEGAAPEEERKMAT
jgi:hypothetical protein